MKELYCAASCPFGRKCAEQFENNKGRSCTEKAVRKILGTIPTLLQVDQIDGNIVNAYVKYPEKILKILHIRNGQYFGWQGPKAQETHSTTDTINT
jgi:hypothetical protein